MATSIKRSYLAESTGSHPNSEVKQLWACTVLRWGTTRESQVTHVFVSDIPDAVSIPHQCWGRGVSIPPSSGFRSLMMLGSDPPEFWGVDPYGCWVSIPPGAKCRSLVMRGFDPTESSVSIPPWGVEPLHSKASVSSLWQRVRNRVPPV